MVWIAFSYAKCLQPPHILYNKMCPPPTYYYGSTELIEYYNLILDFIVCLAPQAVHFKKLKFPSFSIFVSGFPHS